MTVKLQKVGNSMMITLPTKIIKEAGFRKGDQLKVVMERGEVKVKKEEKRRKKSLADFSGIFSISDNRKITNEDIQDIIDSMYEEDYEKNIS